MERTFNFVSSRDIDVLSNDYRKDNWLRWQMFYDLLILIEYYYEVVTYIYRRYDRYSDADVIWHVEKYL